MKYYFEGAEILAPFTISSNEPMFDVDTVSLKKQRTSQNAQRWELSFRILNADNPAELMLSSLIDFDETKTMIMPQLKAVYEATTCTANPVVHTTAASGSSTVVLTYTSSSGIIPKGSFIKFSNHDKVYVVKSNINMDLQSNVSAQIFPALVTQVNSEDTLQILDDCVFTYFRDVNDLRGLTFSDGILSDLGTINLVEAL